MTKLSEWLTQKYQEWEKAQGKPQSYYTYARFLDVAHSNLTLWLSGYSLPEGDDLTKVANRLGAEIYDILVKPHPSNQLQDMSTAFLKLPTAFRERLSNAIQEAAHTLEQNHLEAESIEGKQRVVRAFEHWGFMLNG